MLSPLTIFLLVAMFTLLALGWKKGYDFVQSRAPRQIVKFYLAYATFRMLTILLVTGVYILFISQSQAESKAFVVVEFLLYAAMMVLTLKNNIKRS